MAQLVTDLRVFIASPSDVAIERKLFRQRLNHFNNLDPLDRDVIFTPVGWEKTLRGVGRPQARINNDLLKCDYMVLLFSSRWGSPPGGESDYSSGCEEEFEVAVNSLENVQLPMCEVIILFKRFDEDSIADEQQYEKVLEFKNKLAIGQKHFYDDFESDIELADILDRHLHSWAKAHRKEVLQEFPKQTVGSINSVTQETQKQNQADKSGTIASSDMPVEQPSGLRILFSAAWEVMVNPPQMAVLWSPHNVLKQDRKNNFVLPPKRSDSVKISVTNDNREPEIIQSIGFSLTGEVKIVLMAVHVVETTSPSQPLALPVELDGGKTIDIIFTINELLYSPGMHIVRTTPDDTTTPTKSFELLPLISGLYVETSFATKMIEPNEALKNMIIDIIERINHRTSVN